ncbi:hypothetical protein D9Q98_007752 [Chlorella vulgaris]|uniref:RING-type domain-containing protein n=1 Tax=Chlorella vulgaris TaxID=3077 RepID=A0A9D4YTY8_CHLVU|nr:hypothetical protein D9Q98_007752 [Chlorella vulgaris]
MGAQATTLRKSSPGAALLKATRQGDVQRAEEILSCSPGAAAYCTLEGISALAVAAGLRRADLLERLLIALQESCSHRQPKAAKKSFAKTVNQKNVHGQTPLMLACKAGAVDCVRLLLEAGADATLFDTLQQRTCLHYAALYGWPEAVEALLEDEAVVRTADGLQQPLRETLLADSQGHHRYIDGRDGFGLASLHLAASQGHLAVVKVLIKQGANLTVRCNVAFNLGATEPWTPASTPLHFAAAGRGRVVQAILQAAAEQDQEAVAQGRHTIDIRLLSDFRGHRPYDIAMRHGFRSLLWALNPRVPLAMLLQRAATSPPALPSLVTLAAAALRSQLSQRLAQLEGQAAEAHNNGLHDPEAAAAAGPAAGNNVSRLGSRAGSREGSAHGASSYAQLLATSTPAFAGGSLRGGCEFASLFPAVACTAAAAAAAEAPALFGISGGAAAAAGGLLGGNCAGSCARVSCARTGTSAASVAGCPVCLDSRVQVAITPCGHALCLDCAAHLSRMAQPSERVVAPPLCPLCRGLMAGFQLAACVS